MCIHRIAYYNLSVLALLNCQHHGYAVAHSDANPLKLMHCPIFLAAPILAYQYRPLD
jgi:hypothetical protein